MASWDNSDTRVRALPSTECCIIGISITYSGRYRFTASNSTKLYSNPSTTALRGVVFSRFRATYSQRDSQLSRRMFRIYSCDIEFISRHKKAFSRRLLKS